MGPLGTHIRTVPIKAQPETGRLSQQIESFYQVSKFVDSIDNLENLLELIMLEAEGAVQAEAACIALYDASDDRLHIKFASGDKRDEVKDLSLALGQGILGEAAATNATVQVDSVEEDSRFDGSIDQKTQFATQSILATPIRRRDSLLGVLEVINKKNGLKFNDDDIQLLEVVASQAAIAIENARLFERTLQSERLSTVGKMASGIIHDFKTPLTLITGFVELLRGPGIAEEQREEYSELITEEVQRFLDSAQGLLDFARGDLRLNLEEVDVDVWLADIAALLKDNLSAVDIEIVTDFELGQTTWLDREKLRRVVLNMVTNAKDAMPEGGTFTISTAKAGDRWELSLRDTGSGIPVDQRSKIFELFATFGKKNGTGLGLAMVSDIVKGHGGTISVESRTKGEDGSEESGTLFLINLPVQPAPEPEDNN